MDSLIAWYWYGQPETLYVDLGHKYRVKETKAVFKTIPKTKIINVPSMGVYEKEDAEIPNRNLLLAIYAALEGADTIICVVQKDEMSIPDRTLQFMNKTSDLLSILNGRPIQIVTPFAEMDKTDMISWFLDSGYPVEELLKTVGCYAEEAGHCGNCPACFRRFVAFKNNNIDPGYTLSEEIKSYYLYNRSKYSLDRQYRMQKWILP